MKEAQNRADNPLAGFIRATGIGLILMGLAVLVGWIFEIPILKSVLTDSVTMKVNTAVGLVIGGAALWCHQQQTSLFRQIARGLTSCLFLLGAATLVQDVTGFDLGIDELLLADDPAPVATGHPGRMSPWTALSFGLLGLSVLCVRRALYISQRASVAVILIAALALAANMYRLGFAFIDAPTTAMALHTSLALVLAGIAGLFLRHDVGIPAIFLDPTEAGRQLRLMFPVAIVLPFVLGAISVFGGSTGLWPIEYNAVVLSFSSILLLASFSLLSYRSVARSDSDRLNALAQLTASEETFRRTFEYATIGIAHLALDGHWIRANERLCEIFGYEESELYSMTYSSVSHLEDLEIDIQQWELLRRGEISDYGVEKRFMTKAGEVVIADVRLVRQAHSGNGADHFIIVVQDITGRKLSEGTMRLYQRALAATQNGVVIADATRDDHPIVYTNPAFRQISGYEASEAIGKNCRFLNQRARDQAALDVIRESLSSGTDCSVLLRNHRKDGTPFWNQLSIAPVRDEQDKLTHFIGIAIDVSDQVEAAGEREILLEATEKASQEKNRFLSVVSHEMRSPMNAVLAWASILKEESQEASILRAADAIEASVRAQSRLVDDLLEMSRARTGTLEIAPTEIDYRALTQRVVEQLQPVAADCEISLDAELPEGPVLGWADPARVEQILRNLVDNALKYTPKGGSVEVELQGGDSGVAIDVKDSGQGISEAALPYLFDEFWQGTAVAGSGSKGLGLGLAIVKHLVENLGGTITAESMGSGAGSTFRVRLPRRGTNGRAATFTETNALHADSTDSQLGHSSSESSQGEDFDVLKGLEVVVVDDDVPTVEAAALAFRQAGAIVREAYSVAEALRHFERSSPDVLVSDIGLPDRNGMDLIRAVRDLPLPKAAVLAIAVTGIADASERRRIQRAGFDAYLSKPVAPRTQLERVAALYTLDRADEVRRRRILFASSGDPVDVDLTRRIEAYGHALRLSSSVADVVESAREHAPEIILVSARLAEAEALGARLRSGPTEAVLVAVTGTEDKIELSDFDFVLALPGPDHMLRRLLNTIEASK